MIEWHRDATGSARAREILENWEAFLPFFWKLEAEMPAARLPEPEGRRRPVEAIRRASRIAFA